MLQSMEEVTLKMIPIRKILHHKMMIQSSGSSYKDTYNPISFIVHNSFFLLLSQYLPQYFIASFSSSHTVPFCLIYFASFANVEKSLIKYFSYCISIPCCLPHGTFTFCCILCFEPISFFSPLHTANTNFFFFFGHTIYLF